MSDDGSGDEFNPSSKPSSKRRVINESDDEEESKKKMRVVVILVFPRLRREGRGGVAENIRGLRVVVQTVLWSQMLCQGLLHLLRKKIPLFYPLVNVKTNSNTHVPKSVQSSTALTQNVPYCTNASEVRNIHIFKLKDFSKITIQK